MHQLVIGRKNGKNSNFHKLKIYLRFVLSKLFSNNPKNINNYKTRKMKLIFLIILVLIQFLALSQKKYKRSELINLFETDATLLIKEKLTNKIVVNGIIEEVENDEKQEIKIESGYVVYWNTWWISGSKDWFLRERSEYKEGIQTRRIEFLEKEKNGMVQAFETNYDAKGEENGMYRVWWNYEKVLRYEHKMCSGTYCSQTAKTYYPNGSIAELTEYVNLGLIAKQESKTCYDVNGKVINCDSINWTEIFKKFFEK